MPDKKNSKEKKIKLQPKTDKTKKSDIAIKPEKVKKSNKKLKLLFLSIPLLLALAAGAYFFTRPKNVNNEEPALVETPPEIKKFNSLALAKRPYIQVIQNTKKQCGGIDISITNLKNGEQRAEFEVEYTHINSETGTKMIEGMFAQRDFSEEKEHDPMMFGTCSGSKCRCHDDIVSGTLKFHFYGSEDYSLKGDYVVHNLSNSQSEFSSIDGRLILNPQDSLSPTSSILITSTFGLPQDLEKKVLKGPYGIFVENMPELDSPIKATFQGQDVANGEIHFWDGENWQNLETEIEDDKTSFEIPALGVLVLTQK